MAFGFHFTTPYTPGGQDVLEDPLNPINMGTTFTEAELDAAAVFDLKFVDKNGDGVIADADTDDTESYIGYAGDAVNIGGTKYDILEIDRDGDWDSSITYNGFTLSASQGVIFEVMYLADGTHLVTFTDATLNVLAGYSGGVFDPNLISGMYLQRNTMTDEGGITASSFSDVVCFAGGTRIAVPGGEVAIEDLRPGNTVLTMTNGPQVVRWIGHRHISATAARINPKLRPIRIPAGALGRGLPRKDLLVSRQHRVLIEPYSEAGKKKLPLALVAAIRLTAMDNVAIATGRCQIDYYHLLFDRHEVVYAHGAPCESLYTGPQAISSIGADALLEVEALMPQVTQTQTQQQPAAWIPERKHQKRLVANQLKKNAPFSPKQAGAIELEVCQVV